MGSFIAVDSQRCTGCKTCQLLCSLYHFGESNPLKSAIHVIRRERDGLVFCLPLVCQQCGHAPCVEACPTGALVKSEGSGILALNEEECSACGLCEDACSLGCIAFGADGLDLINCDLCGGEPQCVPACHALCLSVVDTSERNERQNMHYLAELLSQEGLQDSILGRRVLQ